MKCPLVILPCAGYGRRVGSPPAKELLCLREGRPLIEEPLTRARELNWPTVIVTRPQKETLIQYCEDHFPKTQVCLIDLPETSEWPDSVLASEAYWQEWNLLVLPDTAYAPRDIWAQMMSTVKADTVLVVAEHQVQDPQTWGRVEIESGGVWLAEKVSAVAAPGSAWGVLAFHRSVGRALFKGFTQSRGSQCLVQMRGVRPDQVQKLALQEFTDLTR
jgi:dTDP-glucose pyrophosphorylase